MGFAWTSNANIMFAKFDKRGDYVYLRDRSVNEIAQIMGWGWHRTNNTLKELGLR